MVLRKNRLVRSFLILFFVHSVLSCMESTRTKPLSGQAELKSGETDIKEEILPPQTAGMKLDSEREIFKIVELEPKFPDGYSCYPS